MDKVDSIVIRVTCLIIVMVMLKQLFQRHVFEQYPQEGTNKSILLSDPSGNVQRFSLSSLMGEGNAELLKQIAALKRESENFTIGQATKTSNDSLTKRNTLKAELMKEITNLKNEIKFIRHNYVEYNQEMGIQGVFGCGDPKKDGKWLSTWGPILRADGDKDHNHTRWFIRRRCGGCGWQYCPNEDCFRDRNVSTRANDSRACNTNK